MARIVIYPNNEVSIDGDDVRWTSGDFALHGISKFRDWDSSFEKDGDSYLVLSTVRHNRQWSQKTGTHN